MGGFSEHYKLCISVLCTNNHQGRPHAQVNHRSSRHRNGNFDNGDHGVGRLPRGCAEEESADWDVLERVKGVRRVRLLARMPTAGHRPQRARTPRSTRTTGYRWRNSKWRRRVFRGLIRSPSELISDSGSAVSAGPFRGSTALRAHWATAPA